MNRASRCVAPADRPSIGAAPTSPPDAPPSPPDAPPPPPARRRRRRRNSWSRSTRVCASVGCAASFAAALLASAAPPLAPLPAERRTSVGAAPPPPPPPKRSASARRRCTAAVSGPATCGAAFRLPFPNGLGATDAEAHAAAALYAPDGGCFARGKLYGAGAGSCAAAPPALVAVYASAAALARGVSAGWWDGATTRLVAAEGWQPAPARVPAVVRGGGRRLRRVRREPPCLHAARARWLRACPRRRTRAAGAGATRRRRRYRRAALPARRRPTTTTTRRPRSPATARRRGAPSRPPTSAPLWATSSGRSRASMRSGAALGCSTSSGGSGWCLRARRTSSSRRVSSRT